MSLTSFKVTLKNLRQLGFLDRCFPQLSERWFQTRSAEICDDFFYSCIRKLNIREFVECGAYDASACKEVSKLGIDALAIEANPFAFEKLTLASNGQYKSLNIGLSDCESKLTFYIPKNNKLAGYASFSKKLNCEYEKKTILAKTLDSVLQSEKYGDKLGALWIDVEGYQKQVLQGAQNYLKNQNLILIKIEVENKSYYNEQILSEDINLLLTENGFSPIFCDFEYGQQFNVIYLRQTAIDHIANEVEQATRLIRSSSISMLSVLTIFLKPQLVKVKPIIIWYLGKTFGHKLAAFFGSKSSKIITKTFK